MGNLRGGEVAWKTLYEQVLDLNSADLALMIGATPPENRTSSLYQRAKYLWEFHEYEDWADDLDLIEMQNKHNNHHNWTQSQDNGDVGLHQCHHGIPFSCRCCILKRLFWVVCECASFGAVVPLFS